MSVPEPPLRIVSYGGGVQSTALMVLAAEGLVDFRTFIMANVGDDSERKASLAYVRDHAAPYAARNGLELHLLDRYAKGQPETLLQRMAPDEEWPATPGKLREPIPVRGENGRPFKRSCTADFKIAVVGKWAKQHGASPDNPATVALGISRDEIMRANPANAKPYERLVYPLIGWGEETGLSMSRNDCRAIIEAAGLPIPPKSACWFCPFHSEAEWFRMRQEEPEDFERSCQLEDRLNERRAAVGKRKVYLTRFGRPLRDVINEGVTMLPMVPLGADGCDNGWCMT